MILLVDFGSQSVHLIERMLRELEVRFTTVHPSRVGSIKEKPRGCILSGSHASVEGASHGLDEKILEWKVPILGICYGMQVLVDHFGGRVEKSTAKEFGVTRLDVLHQKGIFDGVSRSTQVLMSHGDKVVDMPKGWECIGRSDNCEFGAVQALSMDIYCFQFHPEIAETREGKKMMENFVFGVCACDKGAVFEDFIESSVKKIRDKVGNSQVICALSGGVDSAVTAALLHAAIGDKLSCILVDHGLMRHNEANTVSKIFRSKFDYNIKVVKTQDRFFSALKGVIDPEEKRKIMGNLFIKVFEEAAGDDVKFLAQGTIHSDVVESGHFGKDSATIKSHHNVKGLPESMNLTLIEPLKDLFKDEVREVGLKLGLPKNFVFRHPFPGPGLGVRILGEVTPAAADLLREADRIFIEMLEERGYYEKVWQAFPVLLPVNSVGVKGDGRAYEKVCALRAVSSRDIITARVYPFPIEFLMKVAQAITEKVDGIGRVVYDLSSKPPATIEWE